VRGAGDGGVEAAIGACSEPPSGMPSVQVPALRRFGPRSSRKARKGCWSCDARHCACAAVVLLVLARKRAQT
jgi:hypothetical protein